ncbi:MAG: HPr family phosphocarrier protein [Pseudomonadota bacterium]
MADTAPAKQSPTAEAIVTITNLKGLHARASSKFVECAESFSAEITVTRGNQSVDGKSILDVMMLAAGPGSEIQLEAIGEDAGAAISALSALIEAKFDEE